MVWYTNKTVLIPVGIVTLVVILVVVLPTSILLPKKGDSKSLSINDVHFAQTHVIPPNGLNWNLSGSLYEYHLTAERETMILVKFDQDYVRDHEPKIQIWVPKNDGTNDTTLLSILTLNPPSQLPPTESNGTSYADNTYSVRIPPSFIVPGMRVVVGGDGLKPTDPVIPKVGMNSEIRLVILPFYLFGANDSSIPYNKTVVPTQFTQDAIYQTWPVSKLTVYNHPANIVSWPTVSLGAGDGGQAYLIKGTNQIRSGFVLMGAVLGFLSGIQSSNGDSGSANNLMYAPLVGLNTDGRYTGPGGGLGGGSRGTGDSSYTGIFIHEMGHAWGLPHSGDAYTSGNYPYVQGSLDGSAWGFDFDHNEFLSTCIPSTAEYYKGCNKTDSGYIQKNGCCIRQDAMQGGSGCQSKGYPFTLFPDFDMAKMQRYMEGKTSIDDKGNHTYSGGVIIYDKESNTYRRWDSIDLKYVPFTPKNESKGMTLNSGFPIVRDVDVYTIYIHYNSAPTSVCTECTQIYNPLKYKGNLLPYIDPTKQDQLDEIKPNVGNLPWFCHASGCDFTFRVTYSDGSVRTKLLQRGIRSWFGPLGQPNPEYADPMDSSSLILFTENVPADKILSKVELLDTPFGFNYTTPANPKVLVSRTF